MAKDEVRRELADNPLRLVNGQPIVAADFLTNDDVNALSTRRFEAANQLNLNGKITARLTDAIDLSLSGAYRGWGESIYPRRRRTWFQLATAEPGP